MAVVTGDLVLYDHKEGRREMVSTATFRSKFNYIIIFTMLGEGVVPPQPHNAEHSCRNLTTGTVQPLLLGSD